MSKKLEIAVSSVCRFLTIAHQKEIVNRQTDFTNSIKSNIFEKIDRLVEDSKYIVSLGDDRRTGEMIIQNVVDGIKLLVEEYNSNMMFDYSLWLDDIIIVAPDTVDAIEEEYVDEDKPLHSVYEAAFNQYRNVLKSNEDRNVDIVLVLLDIDAFIKGIPMLKISMKDIL